MIDAIRTQSGDVRLNLKTPALWLVSLPFFLLGWLAGWIVRAALWVVAAMIAGYHSGRGLNDLAD